MGRRGERLQKLAAEAVGQQLGQGEMLGIARFVEADDLQLRRKLADDLPAHTAGHAVLRAARSDGDAAELEVSFADGLENGGALGADGGVKAAFSMLQPVNTMPSSHSSAAPTGKWE